MWEQLHNPITRVIVKAIGMGLIFDGLYSYWHFRKSKHRKDAGRTSYQFGRLLRFIGAILVMILG